MKSHTAFVTAAAILALAVPAAAGAAAPANPHYVPMAVAASVHLGTCTRTYSCPDAAGSQAIRGTSRGTIPRGCKPIPETGYFWMFGCPRSAFASAS